MKLQKEDLLKGNATTIKGKDYLRTEEYVNTFFKYVKAEKYICYAKEADQISNNLIVYNRVLIDAILEDKFDGWQQVWSFSYALDEKEPNIKLYKGWIKDNVYMLGSAIQQIDLDEDWDWTLYNELVCDTVSTCLEKFIDNVTINTDLLGKWVYRAMKTTLGVTGNKVKLTTATPINVYKTLDEDQFKNPTKGYVYKVFLEESALEEKDMHHRAEKIQLIQMILK